MPPDATMSAAPELTLATPVQHAPGVGARRAELLERLEVRTVADLIKHLPHRYEYHFGRTAIRSLPLEAVATACGTVVESRWVSGRGSAIGRSWRGGNKGRFLAAVEDETGRLELVFFNARYLVGRLHPGQAVSVTGKVGLYNGCRQMINPTLRLIEAAALPIEPGSTPLYQPVYPATEELTSEQIGRIVETVLPVAAEQIEDHLDADFRRLRQLPELRQAYCMLHRPENEEQVAAGLRRLAYDELLLLQLGFALRRQQAQTERTAPPLRWSKAIDEHIRRRFPFDLTQDQRRVTSEIAQDLQKERPMNRLLQGDVGSGKTVVALYALLMSVGSGKQGAIMAPTELLAEQHYLSISSMLEGSTVRLALLTGSLTTAQRTAALYRIGRGDVDIVIGTQAILSESVKFADLAVVVVDEQHRFGVVQRATIRSKSAVASSTPHTLVMTATPIPRTLSLSVFGDLDVSTITRLPPGRKPVATRVVAPDKAAEVYAYVAGRLRKGEQAYIVLPTIDELEPGAGAGLKAVRSHAAALEATHLAGLRIAALHGRLKRTTRERIMDRFRRGQIDALVATTVIEVGVDVPNASLMIVEHAERFGLAQLHQLRGRIGRGGRKSVCVFIADATTEDAAARMKAIGSTADGFKIAEADLAIRGMGEFFGTRQSGLPPLRVADLTKHLELLQLARRDAQSIVESDPKLTAPNYNLLRKRLIKQYGEALGLGDVA